MKSLRTSYFGSLLICFPLLIWNVGIIADSELPAHILQKLNQGLVVFCALQMTAVVLSIPFLIAEHTVIECHLASSLHIVLPLPFYALAWHISIVSWLFVAKMLLLLSLVSTLTITVGQGLYRSKFGPHWASFSFKVFCLIATLLVWSTHSVWQTWLNQ